MAGRIVLFGATGYTGSLTAEVLAAQGVPAVLAGRSRERLEQLVDRIGGAFEIATADVARPESVAALVGRGDVLVTTVGPFAKFGAPAVRAAVRAGAHYLDSNGEPSFARRVFEEDGPLAAKAGVVMLTAFGYDYVPGHVVAALALEDAGPKAESVDVGYFSHGGRWSGGTLATLLGSSPADSFSWRGGRLVSERSGIRRRRFDIGGRDAQALSFGGTEHLALWRSYPQLQNVGTYLGWFGPLTPVVAALGSAQGVIKKVPGVERLGQRIAARVAPGSTGGPDAAARARTTSTFAAVARDRAGRQLAVARLHGVDSYTLTARLLVWGALRLRDGEAPAAGARGPVEAFGLDPMARALAGAGLPRVA